MAAVGPVAGATLGSAVESAAELDTVIRPPVQAPCTMRVSGRGIVGHPVEGVPRVAGRADRRRVVVDAAVVGLAGQRGVGDGDDGRRQPGALRVGGQQHRPQRRLAEQPAPLVEPQQRLGAAVDAGHRVGVGEVRRARRCAGRTVDPVDLHGRVLRPQPAVGDEARQRARSDRFAELRHLGQARRTRRSRGAPAPGAPTATSPDRGRCAPRHTKCLAGQGYPPSPADGRPAASSRCTESSARIVCGGVSGIESRTPHGLLPSTCSGSSWLVPHTWVANGAPGTTSTRPAGEPVLCSSSQSARLVPVLRDRVERARRGEPARPRQRGAHRQRDQHDDADGDPLVVLGVGEARASTPVAARSPAAECGRADGRARAPAAAGSPAPACARCAAACPPRRGTPAPDVPAAIPARRSSRRPAARRRPAASSPAGRAPASCACASPASPAAATSVVASTATDPVTSDAPAVAFGATNGVQLSVPRSISVSDVHCVVTPEDSMKSRNGGLTRPSSTSATTHHAIASTEHSSPPRGEPPPQPVRPVTGPPDHARPGSRSASRRR